MDHETVGPIDSATPVAHGSNAADTPRRKRRRHRAKRNPHATMNNPVETPAVRPNGPRFYTSEERPAATIWAREPDEPSQAVPEPEPAVSRTTLQTKQTMTQPAPAFERSKPIVDANSDLAWINDFALAAYEDPGFMVPTRPLQPKQTQPDANEPHEPFPPTRRYFWNEPPVDRSNEIDHDSLPSVGDHEQLQPESKVAEKNRSMDDAQRQEPEQNNARERQIGAAEDHLTDSDVPGIESDHMVNPQNSSRRAGQPAVQSPLMENSNTFEQSAVEPIGEPFVSPAEADASTAGMVSPFEVTDFPTPMTPEAAAVDMQESAAPTIASATEAVERAHQGEQKSSEAGKHETTDHAMDRAELLEISESIRVDGVSVHEMFLAGRIDDAGLRRIVTAFLRGESGLKQLIMQELTRQQMRFERDPQLRNTPVAQKSGARPGKAKRAASSIKHRTKSLLDADRARGGTEKIAEMTHSTFERAHEVFGDSENASLKLGIAAIVAIYLTILIVLLAR